MTRRRWIGAAAGTALAAQVRRPNILFILADDLGWQDLGCCGNRSIQSPNLDRMASEGTRFTHYVVSWPACTPSRGSMLTGRYPLRNGLYDMIRNNEVNWKFQFDEVSYATSPEMTLGMDLREVTIGQVLKSAGYATGYVGKWDGGRARRFLPLQRGFDFYYGFANTGIDYYTHERYGVPSMFRGNQRIKEEGHATDLFGREALRFIGEHRSRPWFLYLAFNAPHGASTFDRAAPQEPAEYMKLYQGPRAQYKAMITHMDTVVGGIFSKLREWGMEENTLVVFASDNGGTGRQNGPLRGGKSSLWEGGIRVPFLTKWPGRIPNDVVRDDFISSLELLPTFAAAAGATPRPGVKLDGHNVLPVLEGKAKSPRQEFFWEHRGNKAARVGSIKWVEIGKEGGVFDLSTDPGEQRDLSVEKPELLAKMRSRWQDWRKEMDGSEVRGPFRDY